MEKKKNIKEYKLIFSKRVSIFLSIYSYVTLSNQTGSQTFEEIYSSLKMSLEPQTEIA